MPGAQLTHDASSIPLPTYYPYIFFFFLKGKVPLSLRHLRQHVPETLWLQGLMIDAKPVSASISVTCVKDLVLMVGIDAVEIDAKGLCVNLRHHHDSMQ